MTVIAETSLVPRYGSIAKSVKLNILLLAKKCISEKDIADIVGVSHQTVHRVIHQACFQFKQTFQYLPRFLGFDEFKAGGSSEAAMSFVYCDALNKEIIDVLEDRRLESLKAYFMRFPESVRRKVLGIVIDMYEPYMQLIKECFPNAEIIIDRFHIAQHMVRAMNKVRIEVMNTFSRDSLEYKLLKKYWRHLLKPRNKRKEGRWYCRHLRQRVTSYEIVELLLSFSETLQKNWLGYQNLYGSFQTKDSVRFFQWLNRYDGALHTTFNTVVGTFQRLASYIKNSYRTSLSNGVLEGFNNKIKLIKRVAYGYRSFVNYKTRIMLCFTLTKKVASPG